MLNRKVFILTSIALLLLIIGVVFFRIFVNREDGLVDFNGNGFSLQHPRYLSKEILENGAVKFGSTNKSKHIRSIIVQKIKLPGSAKTLSEYESYIKKVRSSRTRRVIPTTNRTTMGGREVLVIKNSNQPLVESAFLVQEEQPWRVMFVFNQANSERNELISSIVTSLETRAAQ